MKRGSKVINKYLYPFFLAFIQKGDHVFLLAVRRIINVAHCHIHAQRFPFPDHFFRGGGKGDVIPKGELKVKVFIHNSPLSSLLYPHQKTTPVPWENSP